MGAFCVFGISKSVCKEKAAKKVPHRGLTPAEWAALRDELARDLFETLEKPVKVSPEFDAPQFCNDWLSVCPSEVKMARIMVRQPKKDECGKLVLRRGQTVMTWAEYGSVPA